MNDKTKFIISAGGIFVCYFYFGILHEKITRGRYGHKLNEDGSIGERFSFALTLVAIQFVFNWAFAKAIILTQPQPEDKTHPGYYACGALTYLLSAFFANTALRWVDYPTQVVAKAAKPIPVMLLSAVLGGKTYSREKYISVSMIVIGVVLFMYKNGDLNRGRENEVMGIILILLSLLMDGLSAAIQDHGSEKKSKSGLHMMLAINYWSSVMILLALMGSSETQLFFSFILKYPEVIFHLASLALAGALGQLFIFSMILNHGSLSNSIVTTTRKFFTVLFSVIIFGNSLTTTQWMGALLVFSGLFADKFLKRLFGNSFKIPLKDD